MHVLLIRFGILFNWLLLLLLCDVITTATDALPIFSTTSPHPPVTITTRSDGLTLSYLHGFTTRVAGSGLITAALQQRRHRCYDDDASSGGGGSYFNDDWSQPSVTALLSMKSLEFEDEIDHECEQNSNSNNNSNSSNIDSNENHRRIALRWMQKFQQLLTLSFDTTTATAAEWSSSVSQQQQQQDIQNGIHQVFIHNTATSSKSDDIDNDATSTPFWRDMIAFTWNIVTLEGIGPISDFLCSSRSSSSRSHRHHPTVPSTWHWALDDTKEIVSTTTTYGSSTTNSNQQRDDTTVKQLEFWCTFHTNGGVGRAHVRLQSPPPQYKNDDDDDDDDDTTNVRHHDDDDDWKAFTLLTTLQSLQDRPWNVAPDHRPMTGITTTTTATTSTPASTTLSERHGTPIPNRVYWHDQKEEHQRQQQQQPYVVIIGGGQGGLSLAARLQHLQVPYVVYEMGVSVGTSWRQHRYPSLYLHDPVYYNHMPYLEFPKTWPVFCPRNKIANFMECYVQLLDLNVMCQTKVVRAIQDPDTSMWTIDIEQCTPSSDHQNRDNVNGMTISRHTIQCHHIVFATGNSSHPRRPALKQSHSFRGIQIHSSQYQGGNVYRSHNIRHVIVVGSNNSALDICQDIWEQLSRKNGGTVETITMIQRTPGMVVSTQSVLQYGLGPLYAEQATLPHEEADIVATTVPYKVALLTKWKHVTQLMEQNDAKMLHGLRKAGYRLDNGPNGTGIFAKSATEGGGFYIDHGCAELIIRNDVTIQFATVTELHTDSVVIQNIDDPTCIERLPADMIIYATGFDTMDRYVQEICGTDVSNRVGRTWGLGLGHNVMKDPSPWEGELRNMWKPTMVDGLWFQGGNLAQNRHYSRYLALQLAARYMGIKPNVYGIPQPTPPNT